MYAAGFTDVGVARSQNQDAIFVCNKQFGALPNLFIVADGMGGHKAGDVASNMAIEHFTKYILDYKMQDFVTPENYLDLLMSAAKTADEKIAAKAASDEDMKGMGTTLTACTITDDKIFYVHIGDSRAYFVNHYGMKQITTDHTFVEELLRTGRISEEEARTHPKRNVITKVLGMPEGMEADAKVVELGDAASILLCSDGLTNMLDKDAMMKIINGLGYVEHRTRYLIEEANGNGGLDNISAVLIDVNR
ncbi:MAG: Stp1/IreP family PP2C-type Ser/Thr phosphatase [Defluviitaleaceae bacterium]|nr:Stp1/IreP family PP2C-type Ser/Thr phosphatase [Defluviitaleaceae bacterium]